MNRPYGRQFGDGPARRGGYPPLMRRVELIERELSDSVIGAFFEVYHHLGFGFLEHIYVSALEWELVARGHRVAREYRVPVMYKGAEIGIQRLDLVVDGKLIVETKATYELHKAAPRQLLNYLRATSLELGLLLHFGPEPRFYRVVSQNRGPGPRRSV